MRILYVGRGSSGHDRRFVDAWRRSGHEVEAVEAAGRSRDELAVRIRDAAPDLVQAGPVTDPAWEVAQVWDGPLIATSWGFDLLHDADADPVARSRAAEVLRRADLLFVDNAAPHRAAAALGAPESLIREFPWGIDGAWFATRPRVRRPASETVFLSTRRHEPIYRVSDLVEAFLVAAATLPQIRLRLAGDGSLTEDLRARAAAAPGGDRIEFLGEVGNDELPAVYGDADVYVSTSSVDGSSVSLLEAMARGVPVLVSRIEGNAQWVTPQTGLDYPVGDVTALADAIRGLSTAGDARSTAATARAAAASDLVRATADWDATVARFPMFAAEAVAQAVRRVGA